MPEKTSLEEILKRKNKKLEQIKILYEIEEHIDNIDAPEDLDENQKREKKRKSALKTIRDLKDIAIAGIIENNVYEGEAIKEAIHKFLYLPAIKKSKIYAELVIESLLESMDDKYRYKGGYVSEQAIIKKATEMYVASLEDITVADLLKLAGRKVKSNKSTNQYIGDLHKVKKAKAITAYLEIYRLDQGAKALRENNKYILKELEKKLCEPKNKNESSS